MKTILAAACFVAGTAVWIAAQGAPAGVPGGADVAVRAQESSKTVADGVYNDDQATRGAAAYDTNCAGCHRSDLGGVTGPGCFWPGLGLALIGAGAGA